ncbi:hypothetical protein ZWY2020_041884 [Hordeum vulgare]|nr:hypothetical protein ZWY2020_041884 [Hordeum vulgare]
MALDCRALPQPTAACVAAVEVARPWERDVLQRSALAMDVPLLWDDEGRMKGAGRFFSKKTKPLNEGPRVGYEK